VGRKSAATGLTGRRASGRAVVTPGIDSPQSPCLSVLGRLSGSPSRPKRLFLRNSERDTDTRAFLELF